MTFEEWWETEGYDQAAMITPPWLVSKRRSKMIWQEATEAERELQPCGHPVQAIRSTPYIGEQHSNHCGWCVDVDRFGREHELSQALTVELLAYREKVAQLREALEAMEWVEGAYAGSMPGYKYYGTLCPWCHQPPTAGHSSDCVRQAALSDTALEEAATE